MTTATASAETSSSASTSRTTPVLQIYREPIDIEEIRDLSIDFLEEQIGSDSTHNALPIESEGKIIGCLIPDNCIPDSIEQGSVFNIAMIKQNPQEVFNDEERRVSIAHYNNASGYSFVSTSLFMEINEILNRFPQSFDTEIEEPNEPEEDETEKDVVEVANTGEPGPVEIGVIPADEEGSTEEIESDLGAETAEDEPKDGSDDFDDEDSERLVGSDQYEFEWLDGKKRPWLLKINGREHTIPDSAKNLLEVLLVTEQPLSKKQIEDLHGVEAPYNALDALDQIGLLKRYKKPSDRAIYFIAFSDEYPRPVSDAFPPYEKKNRADTTPRLRPEWLDEMGIGSGGDLSVIETSHYTPNLLRDYKGPAYPKEEFSSDYRNPDPSLVNIPYINMSEDSPIFQKALEGFEAGDLSSFQRATRIDKDGTKVAGRWVYVGSQTYGEAEEGTSSYRPHHKAPDMLVKRF